MIGSSQEKREIIKTIIIDTDKCTGCRSCEIICSAFHNQFSIANPQRSRIRVFCDVENDLYVPILAGQYTDAECNGRYIMVVNGKEYGECSFCRASCPARNLFREPGSGNQLKCDLCDEPPQPKPLCVKWCLNEALTYVEKKEEE
ncbi:MAG: (4Fe-4S)-binding protein [Candidatus Helarchaeota archaeon]|jgi:benzoyl-CoA reductase subunit BamC|nr:(4Fe-4S)-binding protein [Candidatus Helarchaeota archaeon]